MSQILFPLMQRLQSDIWSRRFRVILIYIGGQGTAQILNFLIGFLLLRWLDVANYAQYAVAFSFQVTLGLLSDLGFAGTIVALVGPRGDNPSVIGTYIRSGRHVRNINLLLSTPIGALFYLHIVRQHHWNLVSSGVIYASTISSIYFSSIASYYGAPLLIRGRLAHYYRYQLAGALFRISCCVPIYLTGYLFAWNASWINAFGTLLTGWLYFRESRSFVQLPAESDSQITRQMWRYILPNLPSFTFFAFQGQIALFLISLYGKTASIAEVGALGRLGQLFLLLSGFNSAVIEPYIARLSEERILRNFTFIVIAAFALCVPICGTAFLFPGIFLWILGPEYRNLSPEIGWIVLSSSISYIVGVLWTMIAARRWIYWTTTWLTITLILATQAAYIWKIGVDSTMHAVQFGVFTAAAYLASTAVNSVLGFHWGPKVDLNHLGPSLNIT